MAQGKVEICGVNTEGIEEQISREEIRSTIRKYNQV